MDGRTTDATPWHKLIGSFGPDELTKQNKTPDDGQSTCPKRRVQVVFRATQERRTVIFRTVLLRAHQGRINKQTFSGLPHGEP